jgi:crotonobetainyl-CoA:carnitine CoA-transferase CaiB-like acyl-CoA transferase
MVSITPFGQTGPYKDLKADDLTLQAMGGWLSVTGTPENPIKLYGNQACNTASLFAANGVLLALYRRHETDKGQYIDVSMMECVAAVLDHVLVRYFYEGIISGRQGSRAGRGRRAPEARRTPALHRAGSTVPCRRSTADRVSGQPHARVETPV